MKIIQINRSQIADIMQIENQSFPKPWSINHFFAKMKDSPNSINFAAINSESTIISYFFGGIKSDRYYLTNIAVHPDFRRKKVATKMLNYLFGKLDVLNIRFIILTVKIENKPAIKFFLSNGFRELNKEKNYYTKNDEAVVLTMELLPYG